MSATHTDLVIHIFGSRPALNSPGREKGDQGPLVSELRRCLQPGVEIVLVFGGYLAITSILWLSEPRAESGLRAGVRLIGVSALTGKYSEPTFPCGRAAANARS